MTFNYNPYDYMLTLRDNKILFKYLEYCSVEFSDSKGWIIQGESKEGFLELYKLTNDLLRLSIPIPVPPFINTSILSDIILGLQGSIEGLVSIDKIDSTNELYLMYSIHFNAEESQSLDKSLILFKQEEKQIIEGFDFLERDFKKLTMSLNNKSSTPNNNPSEENLKQLWDDMDNIDKSFGEEE